MSTAIATLDRRDAGMVMENLIAKGDLKDLTPAERAHYYRNVCESMGLNPLTQPFQYITLNGKLTLYATKTATDQLRKNNGVSFTKIERETSGELHIATVYVRDRDGREDVDMGAVNVAGLKGEALANAYMKALTKAKRRATLSICGLGWLDESETESVPGIRRESVDIETGEIKPSLHIIEEERKEDQTPDTDPERDELMAEVIDLLRAAGWTKKRLHDEYGHKASELHTVPTDKLRGLASDLRAHVKSLAEDIDPDTGEVIPDHILNQPQMAGMAAARTDVHGR
jgi:hypothetical protein